MSFYPSRFLITTGCPVVSQSLTLITMLALLILLGEVHKIQVLLASVNDNLLKKFLLEALLCINDFDIDILGEIHLTSNVDERELQTDGYYFLRCDHHRDDRRAVLSFTTKHDFLAFLYLK